LGKREKVGRERGCMAGEGKYLIKFLKIRIFGQALYRKVWFGRGLDERGKCSINGCGDDEQWMREIGATVVLIFA